MGPACHARLVAEKGKITLLRESLNTVAAAQALNPNGVADLPPLESKIFLCSARLFELSAVGNRFTG